MHLRPLIVFDVAFEGLVEIQVCDALLPTQPW